MAHFYPLTVKDIRRETADCVSIAFDIPPQYKTEFQYRAGQYLTLKTNLNGEDIRRSYSICSAFYENELRIAIKQIPNGTFSTYANQVLKIGDSLEAMPPMGHFQTNTQASEEFQTLPTFPKHDIFFAAGSGITPVISNIKTILKNDPLRICTLFYGNQRISSIIFKEEIEALKNQYMGRLQVFHILSREKTESDLLQGRIDKAKVYLFFDKILRGVGDEFFSCGPMEMTEAVREVLVEKGIDASKIHFELFNAPSLRPPKGERKTKAVQSHAHIKLDGLTFDVPIQKGQTILDAAQAVGADMPFACKGGVCCTCRAKLIVGKVEMDVNYALTKAEVERGFILTCQAVPKTAEVVVDFDVK